MHHLSKNAPFIQRNPNISKQGGGTPFLDTSLVSWQGTTCGPDMDSPTKNSQLYGPVLGDLLNPYIIIYWVWIKKIGMIISTGSKVIGISKIQDGGHPPFWKPPSWNFRLNTKFQNASEFWFCAEFINQILHDYLNQVKSCRHFKKSKPSWNFRLNTKFQKPPEFWFCVELAYQIWHDYLKGVKSYRYT